MLQLYLCLVSIKKYCKSPPRKVGFGALNSTVNSVPSVDPSICQLNIRPPDLYPELPVYVARPFTVRIKSFDAPYRALSSDEALTRNPCLPLFVDNGGAQPSSSKQTIPSGFHMSTYSMSNQEVCLSPTDCIRGACLKTSGQTTNPISVHM